MGKLLVDLIQDPLAIEGTQLVQMLDHHFGELDGEHVWVPERQR